MKIVVSALIHALLAARPWPLTLRPLRANQSFLLGVVNLFAKVDDIVRETVIGRKGMGVSVLRLIVVGSRSVEIQAFGQFDDIVCDSRSESVLRNSRA